MKIKRISSLDEDYIRLKEYADNCSWRAGKSLAYLMENNMFSDWEKLFIALQEDSICGYCAVLKSDCIPDVDYFPYISYLFVDENYRGNRLSQLLIEQAIVYLKTVGFNEVYLVSDHINLYEKYGFEVIDKKVAPWGAMEKIYKKVM